eukprot:CAMPEP_0172928746 /NCGR_PEP_ID=MMETSP1075-20121228/218132_1 /TAXON_ID=2916 /ORGANISM="Ceratium fusus, Strain PA161109" /LENGTH=306 /DNA_ID=CAMNT_0013790033 /DNA_START=25 /DNA_END=942 /DNA_ORIENTATION=+
MAVVAAPPPNQHAGKGESLCGVSHTKTRETRCANPCSNRVLECTAIAKLYTESGKLHPKQLTRIPIHACQLLCPPMTKCSLQYVALMWLHLPKRGGNTPFGNSRCGPLRACTALLLLLHLAIWPPPDQHAGKGESLCGVSHTKTRETRCANPCSNRVLECTATAKLYTESSKLHPKQLTRVPIHAGQLLCPPMTRCSLQYGALTWLHLPTGGGNTSFGNSRCGPLLACTALLLLLHLAISAEVASAASAGVAASAAKAAASVAGAGSCSFSAGTGEGGGISVNSNNSLNAARAPSSSSVSSAFAAS